MNKGFLASCLTVVAAAGVGYWYWSDAPALSKRAARYYPAVASRSTEHIQGAVDREASGREIVEVIDLSRVFEPTGEELDLQNLIDAPEEIELLPSPRDVTMRFSSENAEDAASLPEPWHSLKRQAAQLIACRCAEIMSRLQPLIGSEVPEADAESD